MKIYDYDEIEVLPEKWINCIDGVPPAGTEVIVETKKGKVTALARFDRYENSLPHQGWWDNAYPMKGNLHLFESVIAWRPMPKARPVSG